MNWSPKGVCVLAGPNGAGKTSVLESLTILRDAYLQTLGRAIDMHGGVRGFRHIEASPDEPTSFQLTIDNLTWEVQPVLHGSGLGGPSGESLYVGEMDRRYFFRREPNSAAIRGSEGEVILESEEQLYLPDFVRQHKREQDVRFPKKDDDPNWWLPRFDLVLKHYRFYRGYRLDELRRHGSQASSDEVLREDGSNAFSVLRNWRDKRATQERYDLVMEGLRAAFPDMFEEWDFDVAGSTVTIRFYRPGSNTPIPVELAANGFLIALLHFCAVASMPEGSIIAIDEPENGLHPFAINELLDTLRARAQSEGSTILLATHSPALMNRFNREPGQVYVMESGLDTVPVPLDRHRNPEWLAHFSLGDLFLDQEFGAPGGVRS